MRHTKATEQLFSKSYHDRRYNDTFFEFGGSIYTLQEFIDTLQCPHIRAARTVQRAFEKLDVRSVRMLLAIPMADWARITRFGESALSILIDLLIVHGVPDDTIDMWVHADETGRVRQWNTLVRDAAKKATKNKSRRKQKV